MMEGEPPHYLIIPAREGVGVEPTAAGSAPPATDFEDQGVHRDTSPPTLIVPDGGLCNKEMSKE